MIKNRPAILALLTALNFLSYIDRLVLPAVLASVEKELGLSKTAAGLGATAFLIGYFVAAPFFGARAARAFVGVGEAAYATLAPTIIDDLTPLDRKGQALAVFYLAIPLGSALGYMIGGTIDKHLGWRAAFFIAGGPGLALALTCLLI